MRLLAGGVANDTVNIRCTLPRCDAGGWKHSVVGLERGVHCTVFAAVVCLLSTDQVSTPISLHRTPARPGLIASLLCRVCYVACAGGGTERAVWHADCVCVAQSKLSKKARNQ